jgi:uncharacterized OB-fold protein
MSLPVPIPNADTGPYWNAAAKGQLKLQCCTQCLTMQSIVGHVCTRCQSSELEWIDAALHGYVASFTIVHRGPSKAFKGDTPYVLALIDLDAGVRLMLNIRGDDREQVAIGDSVEIFFEARGDEGFKIPQARRLYRPDTVRECTGETCP